MKFLNDGVSASYEHKHATAAAAAATTKVI